jgi:HEAT repeat protein
MGFDVQNFGIGLLTGWASAYGVYRARNRIRGWAQAASQQASSAQSYATLSSDRRYINEIIRYAQSGHLLGTTIPLTEILVEPRFLPASELIAPPDDEVVHQVFHIIPILPDHPYLQAPYHLETLAIDDLSKGEKRLAIIGRPGSGRTTALFAILLRALGVAKFDRVRDAVQEKLDAEEAALSEKQRAVRIQERVMMEERAREKFAEEHSGKAFDSDSESGAGIPLLNRLMPVYVHLADIDPRDAEFGGEADAAEPLVRAVQRQIGRVAASSVPRNLYTRLSKGQVLLLVDGYDDLPESERPRLAAWLQALMRDYPENMFIVSAPAVGYGLLTNRLGLTPLILRPWSDRDGNTAAQKWAAAWPRTGGRKAVQPPEADLVQVAQTNNRVSSPFDVTLKIRATYAADTRTAGYEGWMLSLLAKFLPPDSPFEVLLEQLAQTAALQLDEGYVTLQRLQEILRDPVVMGTDEPAAEPPPEMAKKKGEAAAKEDTSAQAKFLNTLVRSGLLVRGASGRHLFRHPNLAAYLASLTLKNAPPEQVADKALLPRWNTALGFTALQRPIDDAVRVRQNAPPDVLHNLLLEMAYWLPFTPADAAWRRPYLKQLGTMLIAPAQYSLLRERTAAALVATRDKNAAQVFRQAMKSSTSHLRRLACLGLGALGETTAVQEIVTLLGDEDLNNPLAAALALGAVGTDEALEALAQAFATGTEEVRQAAAETFAAIPDEGYPVLYDAIQDEEMMLRRAAVYGLRRVKSPWAVVAIYRAFLEDQQWYVRSAAQQAFEELQFGGTLAARGLPAPEAIAWLKDWAAQRGENVPPGEGAVQMLLKALQEGSDDIRVYAAANLGQMGLASTAKALYAALYDRQPDVREAAHRALAELQQQIGKPLPAPL